MSDADNAVADEKGEATPPAHAGADGALDPAYERRLIRKIDRHLVPMVMLLYLTSFLDRVNIGNARLYGLEADLGMHGQMYQTAVSVLFVSYLAFEVPSNLVLKKLRPSRYIAAITTAWGIIATCTGLIQTYGQLLALRVILGVVEAGLFPGMAVYLTFFYTRKELAVRIGYLFVASALAGACGGLLAFAIGNMDGISGMKGWRWILIIEGIPSFILGITTFFLLPDDPEHAYFLTAEEKAFMRERRLQQQGETLDAQKFHWHDVRACLKDWKVWGFSFAQFGADTMLYGFSVFLPTVLQQIGSWSAAETQLLTIPCYFLGAVTYLTIARVSDQMQLRGVFCTLFGLVSIIGYAVLLAPASPGAHYLGTFLVAMGLYVLVGIPLAWLPNNIPRYGKRTTATGMQLTVGNAAGVMAPFLYATADKPRYVRGHAVSLGMVAFATAVYTFFWFWFRRANARRARGDEDHLMEGKDDAEVVAMGDDSPNFKYIY
ncbi:putative MFS transporter [Auricularia subglabra TFB-10046 SS5]|nr:putative MFS transporter [Auricularia subglabra TFB-10046 SS5]